MQNHHGVLVIDKPTGLTSRDAVNRVQTWFPRGTRVGHMGTLDPLATGVLVVGIGDGTRLTEFVQDMDKVYLAGILLGATSDTDDADGKIAPFEGALAPSAAALHQELTHFIGVIEQVPPSYSAIKVTGRRAYDLARQGKPLDLAGRPVRIYEIRQMSYTYPYLQLEIRCGKGTYIRSLARDLGERLGCGGLIESLRRVRIGPFSADLAVSLDATGIPELLPLAMAVAALPRLALEPEQIKYLRQGRAVSHQETAQGEEQMAAIFDRQGTLIGIGKLIRGELRPVRILSEPEA